MEYGIMVKSSESQEIENQLSNDLHIHSDTAWNTTHKTNQLTQQNFSASQSADINWSNTLKASNTLQFI